MQNFCFDNFLTTGFSVHVGIIFVLVILASFVGNMENLANVESGLGDDIFQSDGVEDEVDPEQTEGMFILAIKLCNTVDIA